MASVPAKDVLRAREDPRGTTADPVSDRTVVRAALRGREDHRERAAATDALAAARIVRVSAPAEENHLRMPHLCRR